jgi:exoribonuclease R
LIENNKINNFDEKLNNLKNNIEINENKNVELNQNDNEYNIESTQNIKNIEEKSEEKIDEKKKKSKIGVVVAIYEKKSPILFPCILLKEDGFCNYKFLYLAKGFRWLLPINKEYPKIMINFDEFKHTFETQAKYLEDLIFIVEMNTWKTHQHYPKGRLISTLGLKKDLWSQKRAFLLQEYPELFSNIFNNKIEKKNLNESDENEDIKLNDKILNEYLDRTKKCIFTIDPLKSKVKL